MIVYNWIIHHSDFIGLIIDFFALVVTLILTIVIYRLERQHEKDRENAEKQAEKNAIIEAAKVFLIDNDEDIEYIPLAVIAEKINLKRKHHRILITRYLRCSKQLQKEILRQANIPDINLSMKNVNLSLDFLRADLKQNNFGRDILYDGAKYLHRAFERWSEVPVETVNPYIFENLKNRVWAGRKHTIPWRFPDNISRLSTYMWDYLHPDEIGIDREEVLPPIDMAYQHCDLGNCEESIMTFWTMRIIIDACCTFKDLQIDMFDEDLIQTQEDMYYYTLAVLCEAYARENGERDEQT